VHYKNGEHEVEHFKKLVLPYVNTYPIKDHKLSVVISDVDKTTVEQFLKNNDIDLVRDLLVIVHPISRWPAKEWPKDKFAKLCDRLIAQNRVRVAIVSAAEEASSISKVTVLMENKSALFTGTLVQLVALLKKAHLFIGNDAAPMHIAALLKVPTIALFGPTDPAIFGPYGKGHCIVVPESPCLCSSKKVCHNLERFCMNSISVDRVFSISKNMLNSKEKHAQEIL